MENKNLSMFTNFMNVKTFTAKDTGEKYVKVTIIHNNKFIDILVKEKNYHLDYKKDDNVQVDDKNLPF